MACLFIFSMLCATLAFVEEEPLKASEVTQSQWAAGIEARKLIRHSMASDSTWERIDHLRFKVTVHNHWGRNAVRINTDTFSLSQPRMLYLTRSDWKSGEKYRVKDATQNDIGILHNKIEEKSKISFGGNGCDQ